jgi:signal transduction histidine kinase
MAWSSSTSAFDPIAPRRSNVGFVAGALALVVAIAAADFVTGYELRLAILYFVPIAAVSWRQGRVAGTLVSAAAAASWLLSFRSTQHYSRPFFLYWEAGLSVATYLVFVLLIARLREALEREVFERHRDLIHRQARLIALGEFASTIAHELTQPLAAIST